MGLFSTNSSMEQAVDAATDGRKTAEDLQEFFEIVDQIEQQPNGAKEALKALMKRVKNKDPHVGMLALSLLDACVANAKRKFHLEVSSRLFDEEVRGIYKNSNNYNRELLVKLAQLVKKWSENEFKSDPAFTIIPALWLHIKTAKQDYVEDGPVTTGRTPTSSAAGPLSSTAARPADPAAIQKKEEEDFAKAIALSLEEENKKKRSGSASASFASSAAPAALYPSVATNGAVSHNNAIYATVKKESRRVRAMYDFEAVEENELTFKAGEILHVMDDSDANWWKGSNHRGEGLFPTNFVTSDLNWEAENEYAASPKKKSNEEGASLISADVTVPELKPVTIDEALIDQTLNVIHDADPEGSRPDPADLLQLEDQCSRMWPLIDAELQKTDKLQSALEEISANINDALAMYDSVMKEQSAQMPAMGYPPVDHSQPPQHGYYAPAVGGPPPPQYGNPNYPEQYPAPGPYGLPPGAPPGVQHQPPPPGYQPFVPHPGKLAAAQAQQQQQQQQQPFSQPQAQPFSQPQAQPFSQPQAVYPGQPPQGPYQNYPQQPPH